VELTGRVDQIVESETKAVVTCKQKHLQNICQKLFYLICNHRLSSTLCSTRDKIFSKNVLQHFFQKCFATFLNKKLSYRLETGRQQRISL